MWIALCLFLVSKWFKFAGNNTGCFLTHGPYSASMVLLLGPAAGNSVTQIRASASAGEGQPVKLNCQYSTTYTYYALGWYQQLPGQQPLFLLYRTERGNEYKPPSVAPRFSSELSTGIKSFTLSIDGAQRADSAVYFCALWDPPE
uniref:Ig-like domain-containing protein n=1 Tax=Chelydra serpentina TaxID=8475 RepID=A0A8C3XNC1_CHESE